MNDLISIDELIAYVEKTGVPIPEETIYEMYKEAVSYRAVVHESQKNKPLTFDEINYQVKGRFKWDTDTKSWDVSYKPLRDYWILLLLTVNERLFALQIPKVVPGKIQAQFEQQESIQKMKESIMKGTYRPAEGIDKKFLTIKDLKQPKFQSVQNKPEGGVTLLDSDGYFKMEETKIGKQAVQPYEKSINDKIVMSDNAPPKFTFSSKEMYEQASHLCQQIPHWQSDHENPIYQYIPEAERPFN